MTRYVAHKVSSMTVWLTCKPSVLFGADTCAFGTVFFLVLALSTSLVVLFVSQSIFQVVGCRMLQLLKNATISAHFVKAKCMHPQDPFRC